MNSQLFCRLALAKRVRLKFSLMNALLWIGSCGAPTKAPETPLVNGGVQQAQEATAAIAQAADGGGGLGLVHAAEAVAHLIHPQQQKKETKRTGAEFESPLPVADGIPDCVCCMATLSAMEGYCDAQKPMGDLHMDRFDCVTQTASPLERYAPFAATTTARALGQCQTSCQSNLDELRGGCTMACARLPFVCQCDSPPPPPPPPPPPHSVCDPVGTSCCEATLRNLEKFCYSFEPHGASSWHSEPSHWDGGAWEVPRSFEPLWTTFSPAECQEERAATPCAIDGSKSPVPQSGGSGDSRGGSSGGGGGGRADNTVLRVLRLLSRRYPHLCDAAKTCNGFCDDQCAAHAVWDCPRGFIPRNASHPEAGCEPTPPGRASD